MVSSIKWHDYALRGVKMWRTGSKAWRNDSIRFQARGGDGGFKGEKEEEEEVSGCRGITRSANEMRSFRELFGQGRRTVTIIWTGGES